MRIIDTVESYLHGQNYCSLDMLLDHQIEPLRALVNAYYQDILIERHAFQLQELSNQNKLREYVARVLNQKSRSLIVRVDLKYHPNVQDQVNIHLFNQHMKVLRNRVSNGDRYFSDLEGFVWALEQGGESSGFHCHLMLIYDGHKRQNDFGLALAIGECWKEITHGLGAFYTPNNPTSKARFEMEGTWALGRKNRANVQHCQSVIAYASYLAQPEKLGQHLRVKPSQCSRSFGTGQ
ncbi:YagK/YfjJ domain-containing protein [Acinetobacter dispersus]|uniref:YagK/YfjJ domain-containing protein n=1 Tax=Acinetobacter dispersus TaxID=70348 RepID=UPI001357057C|nr:inovirus-type Gp2 protein [Acinetobacter dispersus]